MMPIALDEAPRAVFVQARRDVAHGIREPQADHVFRVGEFGHRQIEVAAGVLQARGDEPRRIHERAVPIEDEELVAHRSPGAQVMWLWRKRSSSTGSGAVSESGSPVSG